jgi:hypothetical protein
MAIQSDQLAPGIQTVYELSIDVAHAAILTLPTTPILQITPPTGKALSFLGGQIVIDTQAGAYTGNDETSFLAMTLRGVDSQTPYINWASATAPFTNATYVRFLMSTYTDIGAGDLAGVMVSPTVSATEAVELYLSGWGSNFTGGNVANTITGKLGYMLIDV